MARLQRIARAGGIDPVISRGNYSKDAFAVQRGKSPEDMPLWNQPEVSCPLRSRSKDAESRTIRRFRRCPQIIWMLAKKTFTNRPCHRPTPRLPPSKSASMGLEICGQTDSDVTRFSAMSCVGIHDSRTSPPISGAHKLGVFSSLRKPHDVMG